MLEPEVRSISEQLQSIDPAAFDHDSLRDLLRATAHLTSVVTGLHLAAVGEFDVRNRYLFDGQADTRAWLAHYTGTSRECAGADVRLAKRLRQLPLLAASLRAGRITEAQARVTVRCVTPRTGDALARDEAMLVGYAETFCHRDYTRLVDAWLKINDPDGPEPDGGRGSRANLSPTFGGRGRLDGDFDPDDFLEIHTEAERLADQIFQEDKAAYPGDPDKLRTPAQRMAAAFVRMAQRSAAFRGPDGHDDETKIRPRRADIGVIVDIATLEALARNQPADHDPLSYPRAARLLDGTTIPAWVLGQWACDASFRRILLNGDSLPLDVGRAFRTATPAQRLALIARSGGCEIPGCHCPPIWCDAHHVHYWENGGPTDLCNLVLVCKRHHKQIHQGHINLQRDPVNQRWTAHRPNGTKIEARPPPCHTAA